MGTLIQDLRYGLRMLAKNPGFTAVAVITLALGIGANTAIFSVVNAVLLRRLPYRDANRLVLLWSDNTRRGLYEQRTSNPDFEDWRKESHAFEGMAGFVSSSMILSQGGEAERVTGALVSANFFSLFGVQPTLGRTFSPEEEQRGERVVGYGLWQRRFGSSPDVIGKKLEIDGKTSLVIGIMPADFSFPSKDNQLWEAPTVEPWWPRAKTARDAKGLWNVIGRLKPNFTIRGAQAEMSTIAKRLEQQYRGADGGFGVKLVPLYVQLTRNVRLSLSMLLCAVMFVLLIACTNVANLALARGAAREREFAVRAALGAGRARLIRQLLTETTVLALVSGSLGLLLAVEGIHALIALAPQDIPRLDQVGIDSGVLIFTLTLSLLAGVLFGLVPALKVSRSDPNKTLKEGARSLSGRPGLDRTHSLLVIAEFALAMVLLTGAGLLVRSFLRVQAVDPGFRPERVLMMRVSLPDSTTGSQSVAFYQRVVERVEAISGVQSAGATASFFLGERGTVSIAAEGHPSASPDQRIQLTMESVSGHYFQTVGVPLLGGQFFSDQDRADSQQAVIINETMARQLWPGEDPIGKRFRFVDPPLGNSWISVVCVVGDMHRQGLEKQPIAQMFVPHKIAQHSNMDLLVRTTFDPLMVAAAVRSAIWSGDKRALVYDVTTVERRLEEYESPRRFQTLLLGLFSGLALVLATIGIYGLMHYSVSRRTHEIGIRMALGARSGDVLALVIRQGLGLALVGMAVGVVSASWLTQTISSLLFGVKPNDPATCVVVSLMLTFVALLASYIPARRATKVDPMVALRYE